MKKPKRSDPEMRDEYDFSKAIRGKYAKRFAEGTNIVVLEPEIAELFSDAKAVNDALRPLAKIVRKRQKESAS
jgi:hypothetical protein